MKPIKALGVLLTTALIATNLQAQNSILHGTVTDQFSTIPSTITIKDSAGTSTLGTGTSGANGNYSINYTMTGVKENGNTMPETYLLSNNYPNPFNPSTKIQFSTPRAGSYKAEVFDIQGRRIAGKEFELHAGKYSIDVSGLGAAGVKYIRFTGPDVNISTKMLQTDGTELKPEISGAHYIATEGRGQESDYQQLCKRDDFPLTIQWIRVNVVSPGRRTLDTLLEYAPNIAFNPVLYKNPTRVNDFTIIPYDIDGNRITTPIMFKVIGTGADTAHYFTNTSSGIHFSWEDFKDNPDQNVILKHLSPDHNALFTGMKASPYFHETDILYGNTRIYNPGPGPITDVILNLDRMNSLDVRDSSEMYLIPNVIGGHVFDNDTIRTIIMARGNPKWVGSIAGDSSAVPEYDAIILTWNWTTGNQISQADIQQMQLVKHNIFLADTLRNGKILGIHHNYTITSTADPVWQAAQARGFDRVTLTYKDQVSTPGNIVNPTLDARIRSSESFTAQNIGINDVFGEFYESITSFGDPFSGQSSKNWTMDWQHPGQLSGTGYALYRINRLFAKGTHF